MMKILKCITQLTLINSLLSYLIDQNSNDIRIEKNNLFPIRKFDNRKR